jgi:hypothetical protein
VSEQTDQGAHAWCFAAGQLGSEPVAFKVFKASRAFDWRRTVREVHFTVTRQHEHSIRGLGYSWVPVQRSSPDGSRSSPRLMLALVMDRAQHTLATELEALPAQVGAAAM